MMSGQARSSVTIMGLDTHMILETVPVPCSPRRTAHHCINRSSRHYAEALPSDRTLQRLFGRLELTRPADDNGQQQVLGRFEAARPNELWTGDALCRYRHKAPRGDPLFTASMAFTVISAARLPLLPPTRAGPLTTLQTSRNAADRPVASPNRAFDAGLRPRPFPDETASLLPGLLAATRTGLPPASDDELTNTKIHHGLTSRCHLLLCWATKSQGYRIDIPKMVSFIKAQVHSRIGPMSQQTHPCFVSISVSNRSSRRYPHSARKSTISFSVLPRLLRIVG